MTEYQNYGKAHNIVDKDVYRLMKTEKTVEKSKLVKKPAGTKSILDYNNNKYKTRSQLIMELYKKPTIKSEIVTQMIYGESFSLSQKNRKWLKIKIKEYGYNGFIQHKNYSDFLKPSHKINKLNAKIYKSPNKKKIINVLTFANL